ncbi:MAG: tyrosine-type recombinase/integrase [Rhodoplanes sp.]
MPKTCLSDLKIRSLKSDRQIDHWDTKTPGFGIRVSSRSKTFIANRGGTRQTLGHYPAISLQEARRRFFALKALTDTGTPQISFLQARSEFLAQDRWKAGSKKNITRLILRHFNWDKPLDRITAHDVSTALSDAAPVEAIHALSYIKALFNWCVPRYLKNSPCTGLRPSTRHTPRERLLSNDELAAIWRVAETMGDYGRNIQLLITTGQRCNQILTLQDHFVDATNMVITFPAPVMKNNRTHIIPLGKLTASLLKDRGHLKRFSDERKKELDRLSGVMGWVHHDIRRAFASGLASLGVGLPVIERQLAHRSGSFAGIVGVYQHYSYANEMQEAIARWENHLVSLCGIEPTQP